MCVCVFSITYVCMRFSQVFLYIHKCCCVVVLLSVCRRTGVTKQSAVLENDNNLESVDLCRHLKSEEVFGKMRTFLLILLSAV